MACVCPSRIVHPAYLTPRIHPIHPNTLQGAIELDGHNLLDLGLDEVRGRIAAIPQVCGVTLKSVANGR